MLSYELWEGYDVITFHCVRLLLTSSTNLIGLLKVVIAIYYAWKKLKYSFHFLLRLPNVCYINQLWFIYSSRTRLELICGALHWGWRSGDGDYVPEMITIQLCFGESLTLYHSLGSENFLKNALSSMHFVFCRCLSVFYFAFEKKSLCLIRHA